MLSLLITNVHGDVLIDYVLFLSDRVMYVAKPLIPLKKT